MKTITLIIGLFLAQQSVFAQKKPFSEAEKAMAASENAPINYDSLRKVFKNRWTIGVTYGQRFIGNADQAAIPDTLPLPILQRDHP